MSLRGKVIAVEPLCLVSSKDKKELRKQECMIADLESKCRVVLWEKDIDALEVGKSYKLVGVTLRSFNGVKYLSGSENSVFTEIEEIGDVEHVINVYVLDEEQTLCKVICGEVVMVTSVKEYMSCMTCKCKIELLSELIGQCKKCEGKIKLSRCPKSCAVHFVFQDDNEQKYNLTVFNKELDYMCGGITGDPTNDLLLAPRMQVVVNKRAIVTKAEFV